MERNVVGGIELGTGRLVETGEVAHREALGGCGLAEVEHVLDEHAERRAPVADVILLRDSMADQFEQSHQRIADDGGAKVPDMHLLGHVGMRIVHDEMLRGRRRPHTEVPIGRGHCQLLAQELIAEGEVQESGAGDFDRATHVREL